MRRNKIGVLLVVGLMIATVAGVVRGQSESAVYIPLVAQGVEAQQSTGVRFVADVAMPFSVLIGVEPTMVQDRSGRWYISVYRINAGELSGAWVVSWKEGESTATPVARAGTWPGTDPGAGVTPQATYLSSARGSLALGFDRSKLYHFGWEGEGRQAVLRVSQVTDYRP